MSRLIIAVEGNGMELHARVVAERSWSGTKDIPASLLKGNEIADEDAGDD
jgi:hypothetical protein